MVIKRFKFAAAQDEEICQFIAAKVSADESYSKEITRITKKLKIQPEYKDEPSQLLVSQYLHTIIDCTQARITSNELLSQKIETLKKINSDNQIKLKSISDPFMKLTKDYQEKLTKLEKLDVKASKNVKDGHDNKQLKAQFSADNAREAWIPEAILFLDVILE